MQTDTNLKCESLPSQASLFRTERKIKFSDGKKFLNTGQTKLQKVLQIVNRIHKQKKTVSRYIIVKIIILQVNIFVLSLRFT